MNPFENARNVYRNKLAKAGVPLDTSVRTVDQVKTAAAVYLAVMVEVGAVTTVTQDALEQ